MEKIIVNLKERSYSIIIEAGLLNKMDSFLPLKSGDKAMLITNDILAPLYANRIGWVLRKIGVKLDNVIIPDGERYKNLTMLDIIFTSLLKKLHGRDTVLIALGGGVIGDLVGFAAASYLRGVRFIQIPTTLLSQVDSSIGGKTAINHKLGKNMIGAFWQPISVIADLDCLKTLPLRELSSGLAEIIKYSIILDYAFFCWLEENIDLLLLLDKKTLKQCIRRCCELKSNIITSDERENNLRSLLNLGHTFGHAIETEMGYGNWLHGEAVSAGIVLATYTSEYLGQIKKEEIKRIVSLIKRAKLPILGPSKMLAKTYLNHMMLDKKSLNGEIRLVLPIMIGECRVFGKISHKTIFNAIKNSKQANLL